MNYGEMIDTAYDPTLDEMYAAFTFYFANPTMTKIKDVQGTSMYMAKTFCDLNNQCRYIIAFVPQDDNYTGTTEKLSEFRWISLQTRSLPDKHNLPPHSYFPEAKGPLMAMVYRINKTDEASTYSCDKYPITVTVLHTESGINAYQDRNAIIRALETYQTIITINK